jgi:DtxR family Mn-dependent transcriptional regulator
MRTDSRARQDYVKTLYALGGERSVVPTSVLAGALEVSAPSATNMLRRLAEDRLVVLAPGRGARLSASGRRLALELVRRHRILETFLVEVLGLDWAEVHEDAEILEHHISDRVLAAIDARIGHPTEDPHGHPIPDRHGRVRRRALRRIVELADGDGATVREVRAEGDRLRMSRFKSLGLVPGSRVRMHSARAPEDVYVLEVRGRRITSGGRGLEGIWVEPRRDDASGG